MSLEKLIQMKKETILITSDWHMPYNHTDLYEFLRGVKKKYKPNKVIHGGDEVDMNSLSYYESDPDLYNTGDELDKSIEMLKPIYKLFPKVDLVHSNHGSLVQRRAKTARMSSKMIKSMGEILEAPKGWKWHYDINHTMSNGKNLYVVHHLAPKNIRRLAEQLGTNICMGHHHTEFGIEYSHNGDNVVWGANIGCLVDKNSMAMAYAKSNLRTPALGCVIIQNGIPKSVPMILDKKGRWTGQL